MTPAKSRKVSSTTLPFSAPLSENVIAFVRIYLFLKNEKYC